MTSIGIMASSVVSAVDALLEPFNNLAAWTTLGGTPTIVAGGRTGTALSVAATTAAVGYTIGAPQQSAWLTLGFAFRVSTLGSIRTLMQLWTASGVTGSVRVETNGSITYRDVSNVALATSAAGLVVANTYYYLETQVLCDNLGSVDLHLNGTQIAAAGNVDTQTGAATLFQQVRIGPAGSGATQLYDDLYLTMGAGATFKGPITIP